MMDKNREAFEAWSSEKMPKHFFDYMSTANPPQYADPITERFWQIWQASRQAIEVELPEKVFEEDHYDGGYNCAIKYCSQAITSLGIRVKGNEE